MSFCGGQKFLNDDFAVIVAEAEVVASKSLQTVELQELFLVATWYAPDKRWIIHTKEVFSDMDAAVQCAIGYREVRGHTEARVIRVVLE